MRISDSLIRSNSRKKSLSILVRILNDSRTCAFCSLVIKSITNFNDDAKDRENFSSLEAICSVNWEIDGREAVRSDDGHVRSRTR